MNQQHTTIARHATRLGLMLGLSLYAMLSPAADTSATFIESKPLQLALSTLPDINFYGRVIDQYGQPVANAAIWQNGGSAYLRTGGGRGYAHTDENGYLELETRGAFLELGGVMHPEIDAINYPTKETVTQYLYKQSTRFAALPHNASKDPDKLYYSDYSTREKAFVIRAWRQQGYEGAIEGSYRVNFESDGRPYTIKLDEYETRDRTNFKTEGETEGDLWVSCTRDAYVDGKPIDYGDWRLSITPVNGGIQETDDLYMNLAPETGYQPTIIIDMKKGARDYTAGFFNKRYYFNSNHQGRQQYGLLYVDIEPYYKSDRCGLYIKTFRYNPTGSRNLEMLREKPPQPDIQENQQPEAFEDDDYV